MNKHQNTGATIILCQQIMGFEGQRQCHIFVFLRLYHYMNIYGNYMVNLNSALS
jgi:hypothetical protein